MVVCRSESAAIVHHSNPSACRRTLSQTPYPLSSFKKYLEILGANVRIYRGNYAELPSLVFNEEDGTRALRKEEEGGFIKGHVIDGKMGR